jgi:hypothetical protein
MHLFRHFRVTVYIVPLALDCLPTQFKYRNRCANIVTLSALSAEYS